MMRAISTTAIIMTGMVVLLSSGATQHAAGAEKLKVAVVTGGHRFDESEFFKLFEGYDDIVYTHLPQKIGGEVFEDITDWPYDVVVLYNFHQKITPKQQENFVKLLDGGMGLVVLHHANDAYMKWPLYAEISGVQSHNGPWEKDGKPMKRSGHKRGVKYKVHVADPNHPVTTGLSDFEVIAETYRGRSFCPDNHVLLTADEPTSDPYIAWTRTFHNKSRVCYIQLGHGVREYRNPNYRTLVIRAIRWTAPKKP